MLICLNSLSSLPVFPITCFYVMKPFEGQGSRFSASQKLSGTVFSLRWGRFGVILLVAVCLVTLYAHSEPFRCQVEGIRSISLRRFFLADWFVFQSHSQSLHHCPNNLAMGFLTLLGVYFQVLAGKCWGAQNCAYFRAYGCDHTCACSCALGVL